MRYVCDKFYAKLDKKNLPLRNLHLVKYNEAAGLSAF